MLPIKRVLFICYANTCRSPAAQHLANYYANEYGLEGVEFDSAGWHDAFEFAQPETIKFVDLKGIAMTDFKPKIITEELITQQDLIIGMERYHLTKIKTKFKHMKEELKGKMFTLKEFNGASKKDLNIPDPYQTGPKRYNKILEIVEENIKKLIKKLIDINSSAI